MDHFTWKKIRFWAIKRRKNGFFAVFRHYFRKTLRKLAVIIQLSSNLQCGRLLKCKRCAKNKIDHFRWKKIRFWSKELRKNGFFGVFRHYFKKTLRELAVLIQLSSKLQGIRLLKCRRCANSKREHFNWKKQVLRQKTSKKRVLRGFRHYFRKTLRKLAVLLRLNSKLQGIRLFDCKKCANIEMDHFTWKKIRFWAKKLRKNGFFGVFRQYFKKTLRKLADLIKLSSTLQDSRLLKCRRCANSKREHFSWKKQVLRQKASKKRVLRGFRHYFRKTLRKLAVLLRLNSSLQGIRLLDCKRCANNKIDHFRWKEIRFWAKKLRKNGFFGVFRHFFRKTLRKLADLIQLSSNLQDSRLLKCRRCANSKREHFSQKKQVLGQKTSKKLILRGFRHYFRKTLRKLAVMLRLNSNLQGSCLFD